MRSAAALLALLGAATTANAAVNQYTIAKSPPDQVLGSAIRFTNVTHSSAQVHWKKPGLGNWRWPVLGYKVQISSAIKWNLKQGVTTPGKTTVDAYTPAITWGQCPTGMSSLTCKNGFLTSVTGTNLSFVARALSTNSSYYIRVLAFNHDGDGEFSAQSYELRTHAPPNQMDAPKTVASTHTTITVSWKAPVTIGTSACSNSDSRSLAKETCHDYTCASASSETCQTVGKGSAVTGYRVFISTNAVNFTELVDPVTGLSLYPISSQLYYMITHLKPKSTYYFKLAATNAAGESVASAYGSGKTLDRPLKPFPPTSTKVTDTSIHLTWNILTGYCPDENVAVPTPLYSTDTSPAKARTTSCPYNNGVALTGYRLFASSYNPSASASKFNSVTDNGKQWNQEYQQRTSGKSSAKDNSTSGDWEPARRGSLTNDASGATAFWAQPVDKSKPNDLPSPGKWLELKTPATFSKNTVSHTVSHLAQDTYYKFRILFTNAVGDSLLSDESEFFLTLEAPVSNLSMHVGPPCIYEDGRTTRFVATSSGTNVFYKWQLPDGLEYNSHDTRSRGSVIAEGKAKNCKSDDCGVMEYVIPARSSKKGTPSAQPSFTMGLVGYNTRGQVTVSTTVSVEYCGCTDPWDPSYWDKATYHLPLMCQHEDWDGADKTVVKGQFQYYEYFYNENTHDAQVLLRVDEGSVDIFTSAHRMPDPAMSTTYQRHFPAVSSFYVLQVPFADLAGSRKLYVAIRGNSNAAFSRYSVLASSQEFTRGRGLRYANGATVAGSQDQRRTQLLNIEAQSFKIKTPYYDFFEYYFAKATNDVDVELKVNCQKGCVNVYTSRSERFPSAVRKTDAYDGYWTQHAGSVCASKENSNAQQARTATASFSGAGGVYGMVTFEQASEKAGVRIIVSINGTDAGANGWGIHASAASGAGTSCAAASSGALFAPKNSTKATDLSSALGKLPAQKCDSQLCQPYHGTFGALAGLSLYGEAISNSQQGAGRDGKKPSGSQANGVSQSIVGRSLVLTLGSGVRVCSTIYPQRQITSYVGQLSLMHTVKPEASRMLFASVQGAYPFAVGNASSDNQYTIEAKVYRYRISSNLLQPSLESDKRASEDRRYSVVSIDNFNYYEVEVSSAGYGLTVEFTLAYGHVQLFSDKDKLPSQDASGGHDNLFGGSPGGCATSCKVLDGSTWKDGALGKGVAFEVGKSYRIDLPYSELNMAGKYVFLGVLGKAPDSSYSISVTEYVFEQPQLIDIKDGVEASIGVKAGKYTFFQLYVGPKDEYMETTYRSHAGLRTSDLGSDPNTWGIDWFEPLSQTWVEQQQDEWDMDVDVALDFGTGVRTNETLLYGSSREMYPSEERGYDVKNQNCTRWQLADSKVSCAAAAKFSIPHFTFSDKLVFFALFSTKDATIKLTAAVKEMYLNTKSKNTPTVVPSCPGQNTTGSKKTVCNGRGSCVKQTCYCDNGFLGDACEIEAFSNGKAGQPSLAIAADSAFYPGGDKAKHFPGNSSVDVPFLLKSVPRGSKVHIYVDGLPYPAKGANVLLYAAGGASLSQTVKVYTQLAGVAHTVELLLVSAKGVPLSTDQRRFEVDFVGGCQDGCSKHGVCHHGYCVCFDGYGGVACEYNDKAETGKSLPSSFSAGDGFVVYNVNLMKQERAEDKYLSSLKLDANKQFLLASDSKIKADHAAVVTKLNTFRIGNDKKMTELKGAQSKAAAELHRKRDRITTTIQQMREESLRLQTRNTEAYYNTVRTLHEGQRKLQNQLDLKRRDHFIQMAKRHDEWVEIKARNDFKLNQLRTANGPLVGISKLKTRECSQDDMFHTECHEVDASKKFETQPGYMTHGSVEAIKGKDVTIGSEMKSTLYDNVPR